MPTFGRLNEQIGHVRFAVTKARKLNQIHSFLHLGTVDEQQTRLCDCEHVQMVDQIFVVLRKPRLLQNELLPELHRIVDLEQILICQLNLICLDKLANADLLFVVEIVTLQQFD